MPLTLGVSRFISDVVLPSTVVGFAKNSFISCCRNSGESHYIKLTLHLRKVRQLSLLKALSFTRDKPRLFLMLACFLQVIQEICEVSRALLQKGTERFEFRDCNYELKAAFPLHNSPSQEPVVRKFSRSTAVGPALRTFSKSIKSPDYDLIKRRNLTTVSASLTDK